MKSSNRRRRKFAIYILNKKCNVLAILPPQAHVEFLALCADCRLYAAHTSTSLYIYVYTPYIIYLHVYFRGFLPLRLWFYGALSLSLCIYVSQHLYPCLVTEIANYLSLDLNFACGLLNKYRTR